VEHLWSRADAPPATVGKRHCRFRARDPTFSVREEATSRFVARSSDCGGLHDQPGATPRRWQLRHRTHRDGRPLRQGIRLHPIGTVQPNGKQIEWELINIFRYTDDGHLVEEWVQTDTYDFLRQLGAVE
jgi:hypothetical protein